MSKSKKITIVAILLIAGGAITAYAIAAGLWAGTGTGSCTLPSTGPAPTPKVIYPWQKWSGNTQGNTFSGTWVDNLGNRGTFKGTFGISIPEIGICKGTWTYGSTTMGTFVMTFDTIKKTCTGEWAATNSTTNQCRGTMKGSRIN